MCQTQMLQYSDLFQCSIKKPNIQIFMHAHKLAHKQKTQVSHAPTLTFQFAHKLKFVKTLCLLLLSK